MPLKVTMCFCRSRCASVGHDGASVDHDGASKGNDVLL